MKHCPHCGGDISLYQAAEDSIRGLEPMRTTVVSTATIVSAPQLPFVYDQTKIWRDLVLRARTLPTPLPTSAELIDAAIAAYTARVQLGGAHYDTIVHLVFDKPIVPTGGVLYQAMMANTARAGVQVTQTTQTTDRLAAQGYLMVEGKVVEVDGVPVSPAYGALNYWGGDKQFKRWHLAGPVTVNPSRNGNPYFMDEEMVAFGATWRDLMKIKEALMNLFASFTQGVGGEAKSIAQPVALEITPR